MVWAESRSWKSSLQRAVNLGPPVNLWFWWNKQGEFSSRNVTGTGRPDLTPPAPLRPPRRSVDMCPPQEHLANKCNHSPMGTFPPGKTTSPTRSHLTEELYLLVRYMFLENKHKMCLIPTCQCELACHCPLASPEHGFLPFWMLQKSRTILVVEKPCLPPKLAMLVLVRILQRKRMERRYMCTERGGKGICFKKLVHTTVGVGKSELCGASQQVGSSGRVSVLQSWGQFLLLWETSVSFLLLPSTDWMRPTTLWSIIFAKSPLI